MPRGKISSSIVVKSENDIDEVATGVLSPASNTKIKLIKPLLESDSIDNELLEEDTQVKKHDIKFASLLIAVFISVNLLLVSLLHGGKSEKQIAEEAKKQPPLVVENVVKSQDKSVPILQKSKTSQQVQEPQKVIKTESVIANPIKEETTNKSEVTVKRQMPNIINSPSKSVVIQKDLLSIINKE